MTVTADWYGLGLKSVAHKEASWTGDTVKVLLCTNSYTPNLDTHQYRSDLTNEVSGTGYTAGGVTLASKTATYASKTLTLDAADVTFSTVTLTSVRYAIVYIDTGTSSTSPLLGRVDFGANQSPSAQDLVLVWDAAGILTLTRP
jgi:hypothetical protein